MALSSSATASGSSSPSFSTRMPRSAPMASAVRICSRTRRAGGDRDDLGRGALLLQAHRFLDRDLVERVHGHLDVRGLDARAVRLDADLHVVIDDPLDGTRSFIASAVSCVLLRNCRGAPRAAESWSRGMANPCLEGPGGPGAGTKAAAAPRARENPAQNRSGRRGLSKRPPGACPHGMTRDMGGARCVRTAGPCVRWMPAPEREEAQDCLGPQSIREPRFGPPLNQHHVYCLYIRDPRASLSAGSVKGMAAHHANFT